MPSARLPGDERAVGRHGAGRPSVVESTGSGQAAPRATPVAPRPAIVVSGYTMALAVVRALAPAGVPVVVLHYGAKDIAHHSRHVVAAHRVPHPAAQEGEFVEAVLALAGQYAGAVLLPASDEAVAALSRGRERLRARYRVAALPWDLTRNFIEKRRTYAIAAAAGVPTPRTFEPDADTEVEAAAQLGYPLLVKPSQSHLFVDEFRCKMTPVQDREALRARVAAARGLGLDVMLQEIVPGPDSDVVNYNAYVVGGRAIVEFTARQLRKAPPRFGSPRVVRSERVDDVIPLGRATLAAFGFEGFACLEFKRDARDGTYRLLDVNGRHNLSGLLAVRCGMNFPLLHYRHVAYGDVPRPASSFREGVYWVDVVRDVGYARLRGGGPRAALAPYLGDTCDAIFDPHDLGPFLARCGYLGRHLLSGGAALARGRS